MTKIKKAESLYACAKDCPDLINRLPNLAMSRVFMAKLHPFPLIMWFTYNTMFTFGFLCFTVMLIVMR